MSKDLTADRVTAREKLAYFMANVGNIPVLTLINSYLLIFYTNICGLDPAAVSVLFLLSRIMDAITDSFAGWLLDRIPTTRMGRFRPTLIIGAVLVSINYLLLWFGPMMFTGAKLAIAYVSYLLLGILFDIMDISLNSLLPVMTEKPEERNALGSIKGVAYMVGAVVIGIAAPFILGDVNNREGYVHLVLAGTAVILICSIFGALGVKERVRHVEASDYKFRDLLKIFTQKPVYTTFIVIMLYTVGSNIVANASSFYYTYIMGNLQLASLVTFATLITTLPATIIVGKLANRFGKKYLYGIGLAIAGMAGIFRLIDVQSVALLILCTLIAGVGAGFVSPLNYSIQADNTDYVELKMNQSAEAAVAALSSFISKFAQGIGGAIPGILLSMVGFVDGAATQSAAVHDVIIFCVVICPTVFTFIGIVIFLKFYPLTKEKLAEQHEELMRRRAEKRAAVAAASQR